MKNSEDKLLKNIENIELETIRGMKDSLSDFFTQWVNSLHDMGSYNKDTHFKYTYHFSAIKELLIDVEDYKTLKDQS